MKINSLLENVTPSSTPVGNNPSSAPKFGRDPKVLEDDKIEETTAGSIASVSQPIGSVQKRGPGALFKGIKTSKKFPNSEAVKEEEIKEQDLIINPILRKGPKAGFHKKDYLRQDHEVEMARSDLVSANKNAKKIYELIKDLSEEDGLEGWVQEKIIKANDYLNSAREYLENKELEQKKSVMDEGGFDIPEIPRTPTPKPPNNKGVAEVTGDKPFDNMMKGIVRGSKSQAATDLRDQVLTMAKQLGDPLGKERDTLDYIAMEMQISIPEVKAILKPIKAQAQKALDNMFGGGNPADKLSIRKKGVAEGDVFQFPNKFPNISDDKKLRQDYTVRLTLALEHIRDYADDFAFEILEEYAPLYMKYFDKYDDGEIMDPDQEMASREPINVVAKILNQVENVYKNIDKYMGMNGDDLDDNLEETMSRRDFLKGMGAAAAVGNVSGTPAQASEPTKPITIAYVTINGETRKYNLGDKFSSAKEAEEFISNILNKKGLSGYSLDIKRGYPAKKTNESISTNESLSENLRKWFKEKWVRFGPDGKIKGDCARGDDSEGKPKCLPQSKAHSLGKKGRASAAARKRREDPNPERSGKAINVATKKKANEEQIDELKCWTGYHRVKGVPAGAPGSCAKNESAAEGHEMCPECGGAMYSEDMINEKKDACYYKVKSRYKVWPSAYASGALVKCRKKGAKNWGNKSK
jgi:hypothetical protein